MQQTIAAWQKVFFLNAACMTVGMLSLICFATADVQYYDDPEWREKKGAKEILAKKNAAKMSRLGVDRRISALSNEI